MSETGAGVQESPRPTGLNEEAKSQTEKESLKSDFLKEFNETGSIDRKNATEEFNEKRDKQFQKEKEAEEIAKALENREGNEPTISVEDTVKILEEINKKREAGEYRKTTEPETKANIVEDKKSEAVTSEATKKTEDAERKAKEIVEKGDLLARMEREGQLKRYDEFGREIISNSPEVKNAIVLEKENINGKSEPSEGVTKNDVSVIPTKRENPSGKSSVKGVASTVEKTTFQPTVEAVKSATKDAKALSEVNNNSTETPQSVKTEKEQDIKKNPAVEKSGMQKQSDLEKPPVKEKAKKKEKTVGATMKRLWEKLGIFKWPLVIVLGVAGVAFPILPAIGLPAAIIVSIVRRARNNREK